MNTFFILFKDILEPRNAICRDFPLVGLSCHHLYFADFYYDFVAYHAKLCLCWVYQKRLNQLEIVSRDTANFQLVKKTCI